MSNREKTGRVVGTVAAIGVVISVLAIIYMAMRPHVPPKDNSNLYLLPPPAAQAIAHKRSPVLAQFIGISLIQFLGTYQETH